VRGERGTKVNLLIERASTDKPVEFDIVRGGVPLPSIRNYFMLQDGTGYIGFVGGFQETSSEELDEAIAALEKQGMKNLILDIRGNPGGLLPQAIEIVGRFIPNDKTVVSVKGRSRYARTQELKTSGAADDQYPLIVLVNGSSASASEIVAGALQDYGRALIVGTDSFGKGLVQRVFQLPFGTGLTLTTARYYTPFGRSLQRDYSSGSIYEYYTHSNSMTSDSGEDAPEPKPAGSPVTTPDGRVLYGGRGIEPDVVVKPEAFGELKFRINEAAFFFVRDLVAGKIAGFESYKTEKQDQLTLLPPNALPVTDKLYEAFRKFAAADKAYGLSAANIDGASDFAKLRVRQELATANHSNEAGAQVLLEADPQVLKAAELMPRAAAMVEKSIAFTKQ
jgi:carboxyl-terminal processing protease